MYITGLRYEQLPTNVHKDPSSLVLSQGDEFHLHLLYRGFKSTILTENIQILTKGTTKI